MAAVLNILFWNVDGNDLTETIARLIAAHRLDVVILAEMGGSAESVRRSLAAHLGSSVYYANLAALAGNTHVFTTHPSGQTRHRASNASGRLNVFEVGIGLFPRFVLGTVHLLSKVDASQATRETEARITVGDLRSECARLGTDAFLICGDFNMNPFERGMNDAEYFHAVMDRRRALDDARTIQRRPYPMLYNPMWSLLGDYPSGPPGTLYHSPADHDTPHWHMLDQFLLSPGLLRAAAIRDIQILTGDGVVDYLNPNGRTRRRVYSDHLPIFLSLEAHP